ncbi:hypothetical protein INR49_018389 [Caranx melampygus]|nr:hypothetical protein INR49_018389 [Caranx melampygus]
MEATEERGAGSGGGTDSRRRRRSGGKVGAGPEETPELLLFSALSLRFGPKLTGTRSTSFMTFHEPSPDQDSQD